MQATSPARRAPNVTNVLALLLMVAFALGAVLTVLALKSAGSAPAFAVSTLEANACPTGEGAPAFTEPEVRAVEAWVKKGGGLLLIADRAPFGGPARTLARALGVTLDDNTILRKGEDGKPDGVLTIDVAADGEKTHPIFTGVSRVVYVVGESLAGPGVVLRAPAGTYSGPTNQATEGPPAAGKPIILAFSHGSGRVVVIGDAGIASAFGSVGASSHRGISEADNARFVRNVIRWLARRER